MIHIDVVFHFQGNLCNSGARLTGSLGMLFFAFHMFKTAFRLYFPRLMASIVRILLHKGEEPLA